MKLPKKVAKRNFYFFILAAARMAQRDMELTVLATKDQCQPYSMPTKIIIKTDCPSYCHLSFPIYNGNAKRERDHKQKIEIKHLGKICKGIENKKQISSWKSEYQDSISKIGHAIMKIKLHHPKKTDLPIHNQYNIPNRTY